MQQHDGSQKNCAEGKRLGKKEFDFTYIKLYKILDYTDRKQISGFLEMGAMWRDGTGITKGN